MLRPTRNVPIRHPHVARRLAEKMVRDAPKLYSLTLINFGHKNKK